MSNSLVPLTLSAMYDIANSKHSELDIRTLRFMHTHMMIMPAFNYMLRCVCVHGTPFTLLVLLLLLGLVLFAPDSLMYVHKRLPSS